MSGRFAAVVTAQKVRAALLLLLLRRWLPLPAILRPGCREAAAFFLSLDADLRLGLRARRR